MDYGSGIELVMPSHQLMRLTHLDNVLFLKQDHYSSMLADVISQAPNEACGIVAGQDNYSERIYKITNIAKSPTRFQMDPERQLKAFVNIEDLGLELLAIYHSHPRGPASLSQTDINEFAYPGTKCLVWSKKVCNWVCHGYAIIDREHIEIPILILDKE